MRNQLTSIQRRRLWMVRAVNDYRKNKNLATPLSDNPYTKSELYFYHTKTKLDLPQLQRMDGIFFALGQCQGMTLGQSLDLAWTALLKESGIAGSAELEERDFWNEIK